MDQTQAPLSWGISGGGNGCPTSQSWQPCPAASVGAMALPQRSRTHLPQGTFLPQRETSGLYSD